MITCNHMYRKAFDMLMRKALDLKPVPYDNLQKKLKELYPDGPAPGSLVFPEDVCQLCTIQYVTIDTEDIQPLF